MNRLTTVINVISANLLAARNSGPSTARCRLAHGALPGMIVRFATAADAAAYRFGAEVTVYINEDFRRMGAPARSIAGCSAYSKLKGTVAAGFTGVARCELLGAGSRAAGRAKPRSATRIRPSNLRLLLSYAIIPFFLSLTWSEDGTLEYGWTARRRLAC
jgi:hypothetical protein